jgi:hypothetical protein
MMQNKIKERKSLLYVVSFPIQIWPTKGKNIFLMTTKVTLWLQWWKQEENVNECFMTFYMHNVKQVINIVAHGPVAKR